MFTTGNHFSDSRKNEQKVRRDFLILNKFAYVLVVGNQHREFIIRFSFFSSTHISQQLLDRWIDMSWMKNNSVMCTKLRPWNMLTLLVMLLFFSPYYYSGVLIFIYNIEANSWNRVHNALLSCFYFVCYCMHSILSSFIFAGEQLCSSASVGKMYMKSELQSIFSVSHSVKKMAEWESVFSEHTTYIWKKKRKTSKSHRCYQRGKKREYSLYHILCRN